MFLTFLLIEQALYAHNPAMCEPAIVEQQRDRKASCLSLQNSSDE